MAGLIDAAAEAERLGKLLTKAQQELAKTRSKLVERELRAQCAAGSRGQTERVARRPIRAPGRRASRRSSKRIRGLFKAVNAAPARWTPTPRDCSVRCRRSRRSFSASPCRSGCASPACSRVDTCSSRMSRASAKRRWRMRSRTCWASPGTGCSSPATCCPPTSSASRSSTAPRQQFHFRKGPIFTQLLLADEVNRASPRTQSALLEAMEERQVSADLTTYRLPEPFFVVATQNPHEQLGTFALPESQLDRFLMRVTLGYPDVAHERELLRSGERRDLLPQIVPALNAETVVRLQSDVRTVHISDALLDYAQGLIARTRDRSDLELGLSPRAGQGLIRAAQAWSYLAGRKSVLPEDLQAVLPSVVAHRLERRESGGAATRS